MNTQKVPPGNYLAWFFIFSAIGIGMIIVPVLDYEDVIQLDLKGGAKAKEYRLFAFVFVGLLNVLVASLVFLRTYYRMKKSNS